MSCSTKSARSREPVDSLSLPSQPPKRRRAGRRCKGSSSPSLRPSPTTLMSTVPLPTTEESEALTPRSADDVEAPRASPPPSPLVHSTSPRPNAAVTPPLTPTDTSTKATRHPVVLDFASFPHIRDLVVSAASRESLIALRAASRFYRDACDARLVRHIVFTSAGVESSEGRIPSEDWYERPEVASAVAIADLPALSQRPADVDDDECYCPDGAHTCGAELLAPYLTNLNLVRIHDVPTDYAILSSPRLSLHVDVVPSTPAAWGTAPGKIVQTACVSGATTVTLLVTYHPEHLLNQFAFYYWLSFPSNLRHLVIHYRPRADLPTPPCPRPEPDPRELERPTLLATFANSLCRGTHGGLRYTLVGLDQTWPGMYRDAARQDDPTPLSQELFAAARLEGKRLLGWDDETADECLARVRFPTIDEYRAELGEELYACELLEPSVPC